MKENKQLEFKQEISNTFLKTVSAFANYDGGTIIFGVDDKGKVVGLEDLDKCCLDIENKINDSIDPQPNFSIHKNNSLKTISLIVKNGKHTPYFYKSKAYKRSDTATIEVDKLELKRLILEGENINYEQLVSKNQELSFTTLENELKKQLGIKALNLDILKTLKLYSDKEGYNNAANILSEENEHSGIDIAKFKDSINIIQKRVTLKEMSILEAYFKAIDVFEDYYVYEKIEGALRQKVETIPEAAFREALANALVHRTYDINANIKISMFDDHIEIISLGSLPKGLTNEQFYAGSISVLRNPILANVFNRLNIIEAFGTGILRIKELYTYSVSKPSFKVIDDVVIVNLPLIRIDLGLSKDEQCVYDVLNYSCSKPISEIVNDSNIKFGKSKTSELLNSLTKKDLVKVEGNGRGTKYRKNS